jgi:hypothetical protein
MTTQWRLSMIAPLGPGPKSDRGSSEAIGSNLTAVLAQSVQMIAKASAQIRERGAARARERGERFL